MWPSPIVRPFQPNRPDIPDKHLRCDLSNLNPCLSCGACCAFYKASFYWAEADDTPTGTVPVDKTQQSGPFRRVMIGTLGSKPWCICLKGRIGEYVFCEIYEQRSSVCRDFQASWANGERNVRCDKARLAWGLPPLEPGHFDDPDHFTHAA